MYVQAKYNNKENRLNAVDEGDPGAAPTSYVDALQGADEHGVSGNITLQTDNISGPNVQQTDTFTEASRMFNRLIIWWLEVIQAMSVDLTIWKPPKQLTVKIWERMFMPVRLISKIHLTMLN